MSGLRNGGPPDGPGEWILLAAVGLLLILTARIAIDPTASLTVQEYLEIVEWMMDAGPRIFDEPGPL